MSKELERGGETRGVRGRGLRGGDVEKREEEEEGRPRGGDVEKCEGEETRTKKRSVKEKAMWREGRGGSDAREQARRRREENTWRGARDGQGKRGEGEGTWARIEMARSIPLVAESTAVEASLISEAIS